MKHSYMCFVISFFMILSRVKQTQKTPCFLQYFENCKLTDNYCVTLKSSNQKSIKKIRATENFALNIWFDCEFIVNNIADFPPTSFVLHFIWLHIQCNQLGLNISLIFNLTIIVTKHFFFKASELTQIPLSLGSTAMQTLALLIPVYSAVHAKLEKKKIMK